MDGKPNGVLEREQRLDEVVTAYLRAVEAGQRPDRQELLVRYPDLLPELEQFFEDADVLGRLTLRPRSGMSAGMRDSRSMTEEIAEGKQLGDYRILREVGKGGMGVVYEAEQISLGRRVALKVLPFAATMDPRQLQRFNNEARAAASLCHPHIVQIHAVGCERAVHFYAMQFIEGQTLAAMIADLRRAGRRPVTSEAQPTIPHLAGQSQPRAETTPHAVASTERAPRDWAYFRRVAELGIQAAEALEHAHALGIVHRDVKPANLMVDSRGGLWVTDFGLAHIQCDTRLTMTGDLVGTLRYMSPEQALAKRGVVDHRTDVYSLGATLYELLTLEPAFAGADRQELLRQIAFDEPRPPRRLNKAVPAELETIVLKAMEKRPQDRYATAQELADDLRRWSLDQPIRARRPSRVQQVSKWIRRRPTAAALVGVSILAVIAMGFAAVSVFYSQRLAEERNKAVLARDAETQQRQVAQQARHEAELARDAEFRLRGLLHVRNHQWTEAADTLGHVVQRHGDDFEAWLGLAQARAELGHDREAVAALTQALAVKPDSVPPLLERGECYLRLDEQGKADADFTAAARLDAAAAASWHKGRLVSEPPRPDASRALLYHLHAVIEAKQTPALELPRFFQQRAGLFILLGQESEALADLDHLLELQPSSAPALFQRGIVFSRLGQREKAAADFEAALGLGPDLRDLWSPERALVDDELNRCEEVFARLVQSRPRDRQLWLGHAYARIRQGQWRTAAEAMKRVIELDPSNPDGWFFDAPLRLVLGDSEGYRRDCREMLQRFGQTDGPGVADQTAKTCLLKPGAVDDLKPVLRLAQLAVTNTEGNIAYPWLLTDRALADYREGRFDRAIERLKKVRPMPKETSHEPTVLVLLAMAYSRRHQATEARAALDKARMLEEKKSPKLDRGERFDKEWHNWLRYRILRREAETLIEGELGRGRVFR